MRAAAGVLLSVLALCGAGCVQFRYARHRANVPIDADTVATLRPGNTTFGEVLARLGAPEIVWASETGDTVLAYAWRDTDSWGLDVSYSFDRFVTASFAYDSTDADLPAVVCVFDPDLELQSVRRGVLRDLVPRAAVPLPGMD